MPIDLFKALIEFVKERKYLLAVIPVFFLLFYLLASEYRHEKTIETAAYTYTGKVLNDAPDGEGKMVFSNGDSYSGSFKSGKFDGTGIFTSKEGNWTYSGNFKNGYIDGEGTLKTPDGASHQAVFKDGIMQQ